MFQSLTFRGGVHPPGSKEITANKEIEALHPRGDLVYPMSQHIGAPCVSLVKKGDKVLSGQKIADSEAFVSAPVLSSVSGTVKDIGMRMTIPGSFEPCVIVENDGLFKCGSALSPHEDFHLLEPKECVKIIREAGIVGMGGATFPTHVKLSPPPGKNIRWVIVNGVECEPFLNCDNRLMLERPEPILGGLEICLRLFPEAEGVIAIEANKPEAIERMQKENFGRELPPSGKSIRIMPHEVKYPQGAEKMLIYTVTGREIPPGTLPADVGCLVLNVQTLFHIWMAVIEGIPVMERIVSVTGDAVAKPGNFLVPLGISVRELIDAAGGFTEEPAKLLSGGPMMGLSMRSLDVPVTKGTSGILALTARSAPQLEESNCIRCARCVDACPMGLVPSSLDRAARLRDYVEFEAMGGMNCIECGSCTYRCPARRYLTQTCRNGKAGVTVARKRAEEVKKTAERTGETK
ncbi:MAG: electron transport complex subunit RsxC [Synergistaceae bacterium]|jgi:electron transport complex protein RnfC|nr:electron transport complex subunit RsxC [Synergistaceae bacterium]